MDTALDPQKGSVEMARLVKDTPGGPGTGSRAGHHGRHAHRGGKRHDVHHRHTSLEYAQKFFPWTVSWFPSTEDRLAPLVAAWGKAVPRHEAGRAVRRAVRPVARHGGRAREGLAGLGIKVLDKVEVPTDAVTFGPLVVKALDEKPDGIVFVQRRRQGGEAHQGAEEPGLEEDGPPAGVQQRGCSRALRHRRQGPQRGRDLQLHQPDIDNPRWNAFKQAYAEAHNGQQPPSLSTNYYDAVYMIKEAIEKTGVTGSPSKLKAERKLIADYLQNVKGFHGIMFDWDMKDGIPTNKPTFIFKIQDGEKVLVQEVKG